MILIAIQPELKAKLSIINLQFTKTKTGIVNENDKKKSIALISQKTNLTKHVSRHLATLLLISPPSLVASPNVGCFLRLPKNNTFLYISLSLFGADDKNVKLASYTNCGGNAVYVSVRYNCIFFTAAHFHFGGL